MRGARGGRRHVAPSPGLPYHQLPLDPHALASLIPMKSCTGAFAGGAAWCPEAPPTKPIQHTSLPDERFPRDCRATHEATRRARAFLVAFFAMAESAASASRCPRPPNAASEDAATAASLIDSLSSSSRNRSSHCTANRDRRAGSWRERTPSAPAPRRATAGRARAQLSRLRDVTAFDRLLEDRSRVSLRCHSPPGGAGRQHGR